MAKLTSSRAASHANLTLWQEPEKEKTTSATSGPKCLEQFERFNRRGLLAKTFPALLIGMEGWFSTKCKLTLKLKATRSCRFYFLLQASEHPIKEREYGLLPTPRVSGQEGYEIRAARKGHTMAMSYLESAVEFLVQNKMLPTPAAQNYKGASSIEALEARGRRKPKADNLADQFAVHGRTSQLNPLFVAQMMGFPIDWTVSPFQSGEQKASKHTETP